MRDEKMPARLQTLAATKRGAVIPLPPRLARLYGELRLMKARSRPRVLCNFVTTLDGVVSLNVRGHAGAAERVGGTAKAARGAATPGVVLVEGVPRLLGGFYAERLIDEQFLTLAPQLAGRDGDDGRPGLVMGKLFAPQDPRWGTLSDVRRSASHLFLRYIFD